MKKHLLFASASVLLATMTANAQSITITQADMPAMGKVAIEANDTLLTGITPGGAGASQTWNFSTLTIGSLDTTGIVAPSTLFHFSDFPTANIGAVTPAGGESYALASPTSLEMQGAYGDFGLLGMSVIKFTPSEKMLSLPSTFNTAFTDNYTLNVKAPFSTYPGIDSIKMDASFAVTSLIDGWGTLTTPTYSNVPSLRQKRTTVETSASYIHITGGAWMPNPVEVTTSHTYTWYSNTIQYSLLEIGTDSAETTTTDAKYLVSFSTGTVGVHESAKNNLLVYPNPAVDNIIVAGVTEVSALVITDITGKLVSSEFLQNNRNNINVSKYENGIYFYQVINKSGNTIGKGKFVVAK